METFIPSTTPPSGNTAPACGQGNPSGSTDGAASPAGLFQRILTTSRAEQTAGNGNPEGAAAEGKGGNVAVDDAGAGETASAESGAPAVFLAVAPPLFAESGATAGEAGTVSAEPPPAGSSAVSVSAAVGLSAPPQGVFQAAPGESAEGSPASADANEAAVSAAKDVSTEAAPAEVPPVEIPPAEAERLLAASRGAAAPTAAPTDDAASSAPAADPAVEIAPGPAIRHAAKPPAETSGPSAGAPAKDAPPAQPAGNGTLEGLAAEGGGRANRIDPSTAAPRPSEPSAAAPRPSEPPAVSNLSGGNLSPALEEGDGGDALSDGKWEREFDEAAFRAQEPADPAAPPAVSADRDAAGKASPIRPAAPAPAADPAPKPFQVGENAFVLTRKGDHSVEITLSPPGMGKLEIEVSLDKGIVNANITAADPAGREAIERSLPQILEVLARDGLAIGGFTVSLKQRKDQDANAPTGGTPGIAPVRPAVAAAVRTPAGSTGLVDLFV